VSFALVELLGGLVVQRSFVGLCTARGRLLVLGRGLDPKDLLAHPLLHGRQIVPPEPDRAHPPAEVLALVHDVAGLGRQRVAGLQVEPDEVEAGPAGVPWLEPEVDGLGRGRARFSGVGVLPEEGVVKFRPRPNAGLSTSPAPDIAVEGRARRLPPQLARTVGLRQHSGSSLQEFAGEGRWWFTGTEVTWDEVFAAVDFLEAENLLAVERIPGRIGVRPTFLGINFALSHMTLRAGLHEHSAAAFVESRASSRPPCPQLRRRVPMSLSRRRSRRVRGSSADRFCAVAAGSDRLPEARLFP
jgi:hypothetical protein